MQFQILLLKYSNFRHDESNYVLRATVLILNIYYDSLLLKFGSKLLFVILFAQHCSNGNVIFVVVRKK
jgi:hypothetical protein